MDLEQLERRLALEWLRVKDDARYVRALLSERRFGEVLQASWRRIMGLFGRKTAPQLGRQIVEDPLRYFVVLARPALTALQLAPLPEVSIVIPVFNGKEYVRQCIESIYSSRTETSFEVIVVDQHSSDGSREYLRKVAHQHASFRLIENSVNVGFPQAINLGAGAARGAYLAIVNSDTIVTSGWLDHLLCAMRDDPQLAVVSPMTNYVGEGPQLATDARELTPEQAAAYAEQSAASPGIKPIVDRLVFFCVLINRKIFDLLGGMAGVFGLGNYEDDDFCMRARIAGCRLALVSHAFVYHYGSRTFQTQNIPYEKLMLANERVFYNRVAAFATSSPLIHRAQHPSLPAVSVIVRTRNRPRMLVQALTSLANQTLQEFEVIVVNDGGQDVTDVLDRLATYLDIRQLRHPVSRGRAAALNAGIAAARGHYLAYLDDDDVVYPTHLEMLAMCLAENEADVVYANANKVLCWSDMKQDTALERVPLPSREFDAFMLPVENWIPIMTFMHTTDCLKTVGGFDEKMDIYEDWDFLIRLSQHYSFRHTARITSEYRFRFGEIGDDCASTLQRRNHAAEALEDLFRRHPVTDQKRLDLRTFAQNAMREDIRQVELIMEQDLPEMHKQFLVTAYLARFPEIDAQAWKFG
jgi:GT2 family glycosyltransferase